MSNITFKEINYQFHKVYILYEETIQKKYNMLIFYFSSDNIYIQHLNFSNELDGKNNFQINIDSPYFDAFRLFSNNEIIEDESAKLKIIRKDDNIVFSFFNNRIDRPISIDVTDDNQKKMCIDTCQGLEIINSDVNNVTNFTKIKKRKDK